MGTPPPGGVPWVPAELASRQCSYSGVGCVGGDWEADVVFGQDVGAPGYDISALAECRRAALPLDDGT